MTKRRGKGEGTVFYSDKEQRWIAQIKLPNGKRKSKFARTQKEVKAWLLEQRKTVQDSTWIDAREITVTAFVKRYLEDVVSHTLATRTALAYKSIVDHHIIPAIGTLKLSQLRVDHLQKLYSDKLKAGLAPRTVQKIHQVIHTALEYAVKWGLVVRNVSSLAKAPAFRGDPPTALTASQAKELFDMVQNDRLYPLYICAVTLGLREGELLALTWEDVSFEKRTLHVNKQIQYLPGLGLSIVPPKTKTSIRTLPLPEMTLTALREARERSTSTIIFASTAGTYYYPRNILRHFHWVLKKMGLPVMPFHNLRHTCASFHLAAGTNPRVVMEILGHASVSITLGIYSHLLPGVQEEAAKRMDSIFT
jgi:integrase